MRRQMAFYHNLSQHLENKPHFARFNRQSRVDCRDLIAKLLRPNGLGRGQVVRHRFLVSCIVGSILPPQPFHIFAMPHYFWSIWPAQLGEAPLAVTEIDAAAAYFKKPERYRAKRRKPPGPVMLFF